MVSKIQTPNIVLIIADDLGYADVGFNGCKDIPTPNIDQVAINGVKFTNGYVSWAACGPSRAGLITGRYQGRFGFQRNPLFAPNDSTQGLPLDEQTLPEALRQADYRSVAIGKWHLGAHPSQRPLQRGFDDFFGFLTGGHRYFPHEWTLKDEYEVTSQYEAYKTKLLRNRDRVEEKEYLTDALSREAVRYIEQYKNQPFFIYLAYNAPHAPLQASDKYLARFDHIKDKKRKIYAAMVSAIDDGVGLVLNKLHDLNLFNNTLVVFISDNGGPEHVNASDNGLLRGRKGQLFEGGVRVPFVLSWPAKIPSGMIYEKPVSALDLFPTFIGPNKNRVNLVNKLDGVDLVPYLVGEKTESPHEYLFWQIYDRSEVAVRKGNEKLIKTEKELLLFDLDQDIGELNNRTSKREKLVHELGEKQNAWLGEMKGPAFLGLGQNNEYNQKTPDRFKRPNNKKRQ